MPHFAVATYHNDNARSGINSQEKVLTPSNVNVVSFGKIASIPVQGAVYAEPLYISNIVMSDGKSHNLVVVATEHDQVYGIDADTHQVMWTRSFLDSQGLITPGDANDFFCGEYFNTEIGITGTPVIDPPSETVYLVAVTKDSTSGTAQYYQRLYALRLADGQNSVDPVTIKTPSGSQYGSANFDPLLAFQRAALLIEGGNVYVPWASQCEAKAGWLMGFNMTTLALTSAWTPDPSGLLGGIWMSAGGPSADNNGNIFVAVANGWSDVFSGGSNYGDSIVRLNANGNELIPADYFMPYNYDKLYNDDLDLGSGMPILFPTQAGAAHPNLMISGGKDGNIYLLDRDNLGKYHENDNNQVVQSFQLNGVGVFSAALFWNNTVYYGLSDSPIRALPFDPTSQQISTTPSSQSSMNMTYPGVSPVLTSNYGSDDILWVLQRGLDGGTLRAFDATDLSTELYDSDMSPDRDGVGPAVKFAVPTAANGQIFLGTQSSLEIFGLLPQ